MVRLSFVQVARAAPLVAILSIAAFQGARGDEPGADASRVQRLRQPVALVCVDGDRTLLVANRRSGSVSVVDTAARRIIAECEIGHGLADLALLPGERHLLVVDQVANDLLLLSRRDRSIQVVDRLQITPDPIKVVVSFDGSSCTVASRWSQRLTFIKLARRTSVERASHPLDEWEP